MKVAALLSGGKDSMYAVYTLANKHDISCLITLKSKNPDSYMFHFPNIELTKVQAKLMKIPHIFKLTSGEKEKELNDLKKALIEAKKKYKIKGVVSGAIASSYQKIRIENICKELNLISLYPLWHTDQYRYLEKLIKDKFEIIITAIGAYGLSGELLGRRINMDTIRRLKKINENFPINLSGEGGEFETFVLNCPMFNRKIIVKRAGQVMENEYTGQLIIKEIELK